MNDDGREFEIKVDMSQHVTQKQPYRRRKYRPDGYATVDVAGLVKLCGHGQMNPVIGVTLARHARMRVGWVVMTHEWRSRMGVTHYGVRQAATWMAQKPEWFELVQEPKRAVRARLTAEGRTLIVSGPAAQEGGGEAETADENADDGTAISQMVDRSFR